MWEKVEDRKTDETGVEEVGRKRRKGEKKTNNRGGENDSKSRKRKGK